MYNPPSHRYIMPSEMCYIVDRGFHIAALGLGTRGWGHSSYITTVIIILMIVIIAMIMIIIAFVRICVNDMNDCNNSNDNDIDHFS